MTPSREKDPYWGDEIYDKENLQFRHDDYPPADDEDDPEIKDNKLFMVLIGLWQPNPKANDPEEMEEYQRQEVHQATNSLLDEHAFLHFLVTMRENQHTFPSQQTLELNLTTDAILPDGLWRTNLRWPNIHWGPFQCNTRSRPQEIGLLAPQSIMKEEPVPSFQIMVANGDLETPKCTVGLKIEVRYIEFHEIFKVMEKLSSPIIGLMFLQRNYTNLDMLQGILNFP